MAEPGFFLTGNRPVPSLFCAVRNALPYLTKNRPMPPSYGGPRLRFWLSISLPAKPNRVCRVCGPQRPAISLYEYKGFPPPAVRFAAQTRAIWFNTGLYGVIPHSGGWPFGHFAVWVWPSSCRASPSTFQYDHQNPAKCKKLPAGSIGLRKVDSLRGVLVFYRQSALIGRD